MEGFYDIESEVYSDNFEGFDHSIYSVPALHGFNLYHAGGCEILVVWLKELIIWKAGKYAILFDNKVNFC